MAGIFQPNIFQNESGSVGQKLFQVDVVSSVNTVVNSGGFVDWKILPPRKPEEKRQPKKRKKKELTDAEIRAILRAELKDKYASGPKVIPEIPEWMVDAARAQMEAVHAQTMTEAREAIAAFLEDEDETILLMSIH